MALELDLNEDAARARVVGLSLDTRLLPGEAAAIAAAYVPVWAELHPERAADHDMRHDRCTPALLAEMLGYPGLSQRMETADERIEQYFQRVRKDGNRACDHLAEANLRLVVSVARKHQGRGMSLLDMVQEGNIGLMWGVEKFDHRRGYRFTTYATWWIRQSVSRGIADQGRTIRLPVHVVETVSKLRRREQSPDAGAGAGGHRCRVGRGHGRWAWRGSNMYGRLRGRRYRWRRRWARRETSTWVTLWRIPTACP